MKFCRWFLAPGSRFDVYAFETLNCSWLLNSDASFSSWKTFDILTDLLIARYLYWSYPIQNLVWIWCQYDQYEVHEKDYTSSDAALVNKVRASTYGPGRQCKVGYGSGEWCALFLWGLAQWHHWRRRMVRLGIWLPEDVWISVILRKLDGKARVQER